MNPTQTGLKAIGAILNNPAQFATAFLKILDTNKQLVPLRYNAHQLHYLRARTRRDLILKPRQLGFTTVIQAELFRLGLVRSIRATTLAHDDATTQDIRTMADRFYTYFPDTLEIDGQYYPKSPRQKANARIANYAAFDSESVSSTAGSKNTGRGATNTHIHGSEVAFWKNTSDIISGLLQAGNPAVVLESTPNGAQGYFYEQCMKALDGDTTWKLHFYTWWVEPRYQSPVPEPLRYTEQEQALVTQHNLTAEQIQWRRNKIAEIGERAFTQEYAEDVRSCFLLSGGGYFGDLPNTLFVRAEYSYDASRCYVAGLDFGQSNDYTALIILDATTLQMVDYLHVRGQSWADMRDKIAAKARYWNAAIVAESNSIGSVNIEELRRQVIPLKTPLGEGLQQAGISVNSFKTTAQSKPPLIQGLHHALHNGLQLLDYAPLKRELRAFTSKQLPSGAWQYSAPDGEHDDLVIALALAVIAAKRGSVFTGAIMG